MAIGTTAAIIGGSLIAAGGSALAAGSQRRAADRASDASVQASRENNALQREIYGRNEENLSGFMDRGNVAGAAINDLLGIGGTPGGGRAQPARNALTGAAAGYGLADGQAGLGTPRYRGNLGPVRVVNEVDSGNLRPNNPLTRPATTNPTAPVQNPIQAQRSAFDRFRDSTGYQFRLNEGMNALNSGWAGAGVLQSGAAMRGAQRYGQQFASNEFGNYMGYLGQQQAVGAGAASSLAGVGQNFANSVSQNNNQAAAAVGNAALIRGQNNPFANALGMVGGAALQWGLR